MIKCICFDMDNTLYSEAKYYESCYKEISRIISSNEKDIVYKKMLEIRNNEGDSKVFQRIIELYNLDNKYLEQFIEIYRTHNANISLFYDASKYLNLKKLPIKHGILTNGGKKTQENKLRCLGIKEIFDFIIITGDYLKKEEWKPNKKAFDLIISHANVDYSECVYVGDSFEKDIVGSLTSGINAILIDRSAKFKKYEYKGGKVSHIGLLILSNR